MGKKNTRIGIKYKPKRGNEKKLDNLLFNIDHLFKDVYLIRQETPNIEGTFCHIENYREIYISHFKNFSSKSALKKFLVREFEYCVCPSCKEIAPMTKIRLEFRKDTGVKTQLRCAECDKNKYHSHIRTSVTQSFKRFRMNKPTSKRTEEIIGCSFSYFKEWLESNSKYGNNYKSLHLDHVVPLNHCNNKEEVLSLCHYSNYQLLPAKINIAKRDKKPMLCNLKRVIDNHPNKNLIIDVYNRI